MSLIPPESLSFPDEFSRAISRARVLEERARYARMGKSKRAPKAKIVPAPPPPRPEPESIPKPEPKVIATPERPAIVRKPILGKTTARAAAAPPKPRPPGVKPAPPIRLTKSIRPTKADVDLAPKLQTPAAAAAVMVERPNERERILPLPPVQRRRRKRLRKFFLIEIPAVLVLGAAAFASLTHQIADPIAMMVLNVVAIIAAFATAITPIVFFAKSPTLPPNER